MGTDANGKANATAITINSLNRTMKGEMVEMMPFEGETLGLPAGYYYTFSLGNLFNQGVQLAIGYFGPPAGKIYVRTWANNAITADWREL